ncbi:hypothetical protein MSP8887_03713 [Marinomonas spartinae]|uniref:hypothetical protein n=1 Tax=Marinomonas spartinae TaxID=1792290 RepID=UPI000808D97F|nr:hypothetical protein [Marinomonas spartinae]SBS39217.1 hypothetical protein MSP8887_03713 [Marinomonas spartinae]
MEAMEAMEAIKIKENTLIPESEFSISLDRKKIIESEFIDKIILSPHKNLQLFLKKSYIDSKKLPQEFHEAIYKFKNNENRKGILLFKNLPLDSYIPFTPKAPLNIPEKSSFLSEKWIAAVAENLGHAISYKQEKMANLFKTLFR